MTAARILPFRHPSQMDLLQVSGGGARSPRGTFLIITIGTAVSRPPGDANQAAGAEAALRLQQSQSRNSTMTTDDHSGARRRHARQQAWRQRNPAKYRAHQRTQRARRKGLLQPGPCEVCGAEIAEGHHDDYGQPLAVRWLCRRHHREWHRENVACVPLIDDAPSVVPGDDEGEL